MNQVFIAEGMGNGFFFNDAWPELLTDLLSELKEPSKERLNLSNVRWFSLKDYPWSSFSDAKEIISALSSFWKKMAELNESMLKENGIGTMKWQITVRPDRYLNKRIVTLRITYLPIGKEGSITSAGYIFYSKSKELYYLWHADFIEIAEGFED
jgi:hypothetical protein